MTGQARETNWAVREKTRARGLAAQVAPNLGPDRGTTGGFPVTSSSEVLPPINKVRSIKYVCQAMALTTSRLPVHTSFSGYYDLDRISPGWRSRAL